MEPPLKKRKTEDCLQASDMVSLIGETAFDIIMNRRNPKKKTLQYKQVCMDVVHVPQNKRISNASILNRKFDTAKHVEIYIIKNFLESYNVVFDKAAAEMKRIIFGQDWEKTCAWTGERPLKGLSVDHLYPIRGAFGNAKKVKSGWRDGGLRGGHSQWNTLMVLKQYNSGFKIFDHSKTHGWKKDVSWQMLTSEEEKQCTPQELDFYTKLKKWRKYCDSRGARYCWKFTRAMNLELEATYDAFYEELVRKVDHMERHAWSIVKNGVTLNYNNEHNESY